VGNTLSKLAHTCERIRDEAGMQTDTVELSGWRIDEARRRRLLTVTELARRSGLSIEWLRQVRKGRAISFVCAKRIAKVLGVPVRSLLEDAELQSRGRSRGGAEVVDAIAPGRLDSVEESS
jgi:transcriptional regulator with XRE-family HTH domain